MLTPSIYYFLQNILLQLFLNWPVLTVIQILQINLDITFHFHPKQFRSLVSKITEPPQIHFQQDNVSQFTELISTIDLTAQLATNTTDIHIDDFNPKDQSGSMAKLLVGLLVISMNYFNLFSMNTILTLSTYQNLFVFIDDIHDIQISQTNPILF